VTPARPAPAGRSLVVAGIAALAGCALLIALGTWQMERKAWKEALIDAMSQRLAADSGELPSRESWSRLDPADAEFRRVRFAGEFVHGQEALVYTGGSAMRSDASGPGYWVFTPARLVDGGLVVVNRGFVPEGRQPPTSRSAGQVVGTISIVGVMRWPESPGLFAPNPDPARNLWFRRDHRAIASAKGWGAVPPFYIEAEAPIPPGGFPRSGKLRVNLPNNHLQYALTWYGLAIVLGAMFIAYARQHWRGRARPANSALRA
jgi:surfeit locus 1 family protein